ncbi:HEAT repeat domain-containing protein [Nonomuraea sp. NPDC050680]|uniref:HEAT repeat domain-containing protein n=1 Tax=Nonomuraea sp. NPDC050680 TaxID=3154630 RepID=UPI0033C6745B
MDQAYDQDFMEGDGLERHQGTDLDIRTVMARMPRDVKEWTKLSEVPWARFLHAYGPANDIPDLLTGIRSGDAAIAARALDELRGAICHQGTTYPSSALVVPFLLRIAADPTTHHRADVLKLPADSARCIMYVRPGSREGLLQTIPSPPVVLFDNGGYPANWSVEAARDAIAADAHIVLPLLDDADAAVRQAACYVLAVATGDGRRISAALRERLDVEDVPGVRVSLTLAIAQLARDRPDERQSAIDWTRASWSDPAQPAEVRLGAALAWSCLADDDPVPDELFAVLTETVSLDRSRMMEQVPWVWDIPYPDRGFYRCLEAMFGPGVYRWLHPNSV